ncbi:hypothetical protein BJY01DRAFT_227508 [Aspergillus pseudoustus]|uniref:Uncharacterized protein n=1 Tax=Aspergillus pseudoustus TaxID=1810923 RepID=A0ABR4IQT6_9EURO
MALSPEAAIALIALVVTCIAGLWFLLRRHNGFHRWWNRRLYSGSGGGSELPLFSVPSYTNRDTLAPNTNSRSGPGTFVNQSSWYLPLDSSRGIPPLPPPLREEPCFIHYRCTVV